MVQIYWQFGVYKNFDSLAKEAERCVLAKKEELQEKKELKDALEGSGCPLSAS